MQILSRIGELKFSKLWQLAWIGIKNPLMVFPTNKATIRTMQICDKIYGDTHHGDNKANAFRHALWNILIAKKAMKMGRSKEGALSWADEITSLHEKLMPNPPLERTMDLHNNKIGRKFFPNLMDSSEEEIISFLKRKLNDAVLIKTVEETEDLENVLVYLVE